MNTSMSEGSTQKNKQRKLTVFSESDSQLKLS
jgi:hypothetical protein